MIRECIRDLNALPIVHDWTIKSPPQAPIPKTSIPKLTESMMVQVKELHNRALHTICVENSQTVLDLKQRLSKLTRIPLNEQRLVIDGRVLKNTQQLVDVLHNSKNPTIHLIRIDHVEPSSSSGIQTIENRDTKLPSTTDDASNLDLGPSFFQEFLEFLISKFGQDRGHLLWESYRKDYEEWMKQKNLIH